MSEFLANDDRALAKTMAAHLLAAREGAWAVAYVRTTFLDLFQGELQDLMSRGGRLRLITGSGQHFTQAEALERLQRLGVQIRVFDSPGVTFHPKLYLFWNGSQSVIVGSANLSAGALSSNVEAAAEISSTTDPSFTSRARQWFDGVWERAVPLSNTLLNWFRANERNESDDEFSRTFQEEREKYEAQRETIFIRENIFRLGQRYTNQELGSIAKVSRQGGIRYHGSSFARPERCVIVLSPESESPYRDQILENGQVILYTGEGLRGDQLIHRGNKVLSEQNALGTALHGFQKLDTNDYLYLGQYRVVATTQEAQSDADGSTRKVVMFRLHRLG